MPIRTAPSKYGDDRHQLILNTIIECYENDDRVLAVLLFGSLGRGNWDQYSDLDLDVIMRDNGPDAGVIDAQVELHNLCDFIKRKHQYDAIIIADEEEGDVVLSNRLEFSIRYHTLATTKPAILDSMVLLHGTLSLDDVRAAGEANRTEYEPELEVLISQTIRYTLGLHNSIQRERIWMALELLHRIRVNFMQLYTITHGGGVRAMQHFEANASSELQERLKQLVVEPNLVSLQNAFQLIISIFNDETNAFLRGQYQLTHAQKLILSIIH